MNKLEEARQTINEIDRQMAELYVRRMHAVSDVANWKEANSLPIYDAAREAQVLARNAAWIPDEALAAGYKQVLNTMMATSRQYQHDRRPAPIGTRLSVRLATDAYDVTVAAGGLSHASQLFDLDRDVFILTDSGVPAAYAEAVAAQCDRDRHRVVIHTIPEGEPSKTPEVWLDILRAMLDADFDRTGCVVGVGGGVVCDMAGFAASAFMRGVDHYFIPTTLLCQIDASVGGKTAVDFHGLKNIVGAFRQPKGVLIDPDLLGTLDPRQLACGMAEAVKAGMIADPALFALFESEDPAAHLSEIITRSVNMKIRVVENDEKESSLRKILNFGHTIGHGIESVEEGRLYHGECVALGMIPLCAPDVRARLVPVLEKLGLPTAWEGDTDAVLEAIKHDKKSSGNTITVVLVEEIGTYRLVRMTPEELRGKIEQLRA